MLTGCVACSAESCILELTVVWHLKHLLFYLMYVQTVNQPGKRKVKVHFVLKSICHCIVDLSDNHCSVYGLFVNWQKCTWERALICWIQWKYRQLSVYILLSNMLSARSYCTFTHFFHTFWICPLFIKKSSSYCENNAQMFLQVTFHPTDIIPWVEREIQELHYYDGTAIYNNSSIASSLEEGPSGPCPLVIEARMSWQIHW